MQNHHFHFYLPYYDVYCMIIRSCGSFTVTQIEKMLGTTLVSRSYYADHGMIRAAEQAFITASSLLVAVSVLAMRI